MINWNDLNKSKKCLESEVENIFKVYGYEIEIKAEDLNLLKSENSCIRSSTAIGYIIEEFVYQKLKNIIKFDISKSIHRSGVSTQNSSFDFIYSTKTYDVLVNIKTEINGSHNNAVSAIKKLYSDYNNYYNKGRDFYFIVLKIRYEIDDKDKKNNIEKFYDKIHITSISSYALEEIDFSSGHMQDYRNWSREFKNESGRLIVTNKFYEQHKLNDNDELSSLKTLISIEKMFN
ncbi:UpaP162 family type II restriction enzyme [Mycoplasmopsis verecunda]|uniref:Restriction endonuclease n=1 Tax=Mycoplasmopsis verecunda TaxID=171291 RepID=A0A1T4L4Q7_9BACT|nr:hypothetical protein [Mycoplasmopsis verecunda]WPB54433.1 hypothetical protein SAM46_03010 [Mycoplasmopsis verecunda]SJZ49557.1 hypothetical protein SAMN02745154_00326 [Mycoplasmopsis verecunda]